MKFTMIAVVAAVIIGFCVSCEKKEPTPGAKLDSAIEKVSEAGK